SSSEAVENGELLKAYKMGLKADKLKKSQKVMSTQHKLKKYRRKLAQQLDAPLDTTLNLKEPSATYLDSLYRQVENNPEISDSVRLAKSTYQKAQIGVRASKQDYIPDVTLFASGAYMDG